LCQDLWGLSLSYSLARVLAISLSRSRSLSRARSLSLSRSLSLPLSPSLPHSLSLSRSLALSLSRSLALAHSVYGEVLMEEEAAVVDLGGELAYVTFYEVSLSLVFSRSLSFSLSHTHTRYMARC